MTRETRLLILVGVQILLAFIYSFLSCLFSSSTFRMHWLRKPTIPAPGWKVWYLQRHLSVWHGRPFLFQGKICYFFYSPLQLFDAIGQKRKRICGRKLSILPIYEVRQLWGINDKFSLINITISQSNHTCWAYLLAHAFTHFVQKLSVGSTNNW